MPAKCKINRVHSRTKLSFSLKSVSKSSSKSKQSNASSESCESSSSRSSKLFRPHNRHARRTNVHINHHRAPVKREKHSRTSMKNKRLQIFLISQQYKRKMSDVSEVSDEQFLKKRKISWGEESQFVTFDKNNSCDSIRHAPRHKFSIDE